MEPHCVVISARWVATLRLAEPGEYLSEGPHISVRIECYGKPVSEYGISRTVTEAFREFPQDPKVELLTLLDELQKQPLTAWDLKNLGFLIRVTNALASHLLEGGWTTGWCGGMGLKPHRGEWIVPQSRKRPRPVIISVGFEEYILTPRRFLKYEGPKRLGVRRKGAAA